jgi:hypothetical protein
MKRDFIRDLLSAWMRREGLAFCKPAEASFPICGSALDQVEDTLVDLVIDAYEVELMHSRASKTLDMPKADVDALVIKCGGAA